MAFQALDKDGAAVTIQNPALGRVAAAACVPVALSNEDLAAVGALPTGAATAANQASELTALATIITNTTGLATASAQSASGSNLATIASNTTGAATAALQSALNAKLPAALGPQTGVTSLSTTPSTDQDPIYDHANAVKASVTTTSATAITPPTGAKFMRVHATADMFVRTDGTAAADAAGSIKLIANQPETIPVVAAIAVTAIVASGTGTLYATPMKVR